MDINADQPPFWPQTSASMSDRRRPSSDPILTLPILIIILPIIALILLFIVIPPFLALTSQIFRPYSNSTVKRSWDSLNILLVLFAIFCGMLARRNDDESNSGSNFNNDSNRSDSMEKSRQPFSDHQWFDPPLRSTPARGIGRLRRSSSSYPDLRQDGLWETGDNDRLRFFDDFDIQDKYYRSAFNGAAEYELDNNYAQQLRRTRSNFEEYSQVKVIPVDNFVSCSSPVPLPKSPKPMPPPPPPPPPAVRHKPRRIYQTIACNKERKAQSDVNRMKAQLSPPPPPQRPPPPPPPPVQTGSRSEQKYVKIERRKSNATKEIKTVLVSLYNQGKRIKKKRKTKNNNLYDYDKFAHSTTEYSTIPPPSPLPPPPPPPPPPRTLRPPSVLHNLFKKNHKSKKVHDAPLPPPPPPPAPPRLSRRKCHEPPPPPPPPAPPRPPIRNNSKPLLPTSARDINRLYDENVNSGNQSPLIPRPPPPPPFKMAKFRFVVRGDFVSIQSGHSSRCSSPELEDVDGAAATLSSKEKVNVLNDEDRFSSTTFCPSPDVNVKADSFIAKLRDEWRLEKINSIREKNRL